MPTYNRQIILFSENLNYSGPAVIDKRHHPLTILELQKFTVRQKVQCYGKRKSLTVNSLSLSSFEWAHPPFGDISFVERYILTIIVVAKRFLVYFLIRACNDGKHPLNGKVLVVSTYSIPPFMYIDENNVIHDGIGIRLLDTLSDYFKFKCESIFPGLYWKMLENGTVLGSIGEVGLSYYTYWIN